MVKFFITILSEVNLFPNPVFYNQEVVVENATYIEVYDILGRLLKKIKGNSFKCDLSAGTYMLYINDKETKKLLVQ